MSSLQIAIRDAAKMRYATRGSGSREPQMSIDEARLVVAAVASLAIIALFAWLFLIAPGFLVTRSDQTRAPLAVDTPVETVAAFEALGAIEQCAASSGLHELLGTRWLSHVTRGVSFLTYTVSRENCGSASLVIPAFGASDEYRAAAGALIEHLITMGTTLGSQERLRADAERMAREAREFHALARDLGVGYRLIAWQAK